MAATPSIKRALIEKSNTTILIVASVACFVVIFCLVAAWSLFGQFGYQSQVIGADRTALNQLTADISSIKTLKVSYDALVSTPTNIIGGNPTGAGPQDGGNTKIILDALPSKYDYPALATSLENILTAQAVQIQSISGTDDAAAQVAVKNATSPTPQTMPFQLSVTGSYDNIQHVVSALERSIRPMQIKTFEVAGDQSQLTLTLAAQTYWQPAKDLSIKTKVVQ